MFPTPAGVLQLIEIKTAAKRMFQKRLAELELYENKNDYVAICAENFMALARRIMSVGQGQEGYTVKITYDRATYPRIDLYQRKRMDALRDQYVLKESLTIGYQDDTDGWLIKHIKYDGDKETCVDSLFEGDSPIVAAERGHWFLIFYWSFGAYHCSYLEFPAFLHLYIRSHRRRHRLR